ncbi:restriction endonuclease [Sediminibacillus albus]|uniref:Restriction endonuclease n=1 Tax=Sediminibacillus albus TaxID=407036 RepID=A0A1G9A3U4_9BACI|nr:restriction endonuclease [Sediminibacillus albus]SDK21265.1 Restriction endonuclease [Sediminibacillus albus]
MKLKVYLNGVLDDLVNSVQELNEKYSDKDLIIVDSQSFENEERIFFQTLDFFETYTPSTEKYTFVKKERTFERGALIKVIDFKELPEDGILFEQLIREIFIREGFEIHWTGVGPDQGKDLVLIEKASGPFSRFERKWLVECKHKAISGKSLGINEINSMVDSCRSIGAEGYLLACSTQPTSGLVKRLEDTQQASGILFKYWDSIEIEKRLFQPNSFPLIHMFFSNSSSKVGWRIYNSESPSFWAANYKDYFVYLSSRVSMTFPDLRDVENIFKIIESAPKLPENQTLRPRAIHFDNKHEQYTVYVDYLVDNEDRIILKPSQLNKYFKDGQGLYSDNEYSWYLTNWDIKLVKENHLSDHYHLDGKMYYEPFMQDFKGGSYRDDSLGDKVYGLDLW